MSTPRPTLEVQPDRLLRDLDELATITQDDEPGWTREAFSEPYRVQREFMLTLMQHAGLEAHIDAAGNVIGVLRGRNSTLPPLMTGSHTDTVRGGGRFDGIIGVLGALETVRMYQEAGHVPERDLIVVDFYGEEANSFGVSCIGSRSISGNLRPEHLDRVDPDSGIRLGEMMERSGLDPQRSLTTSWTERLTARLS